MMPEGVAAPRGLLLGQAAERADEQDPATRYATVRTPLIGEPPVADGRDEAGPSRRNIFSIRCVTRKPPATLMAAKQDGQRAEHRGEVQLTADLQHAAHDDDAADGVGDAHQRRVQRRRDRSRSPASPRSRPARTRWSAARSPAGAKRPSMKSRPMTSARRAWCPRRAGWASGDVLLLGLGEAAVAAPLLRRRRHRGGRGLAWAASGGQDLALVHHQRGTNHVVSSSSVNAVAVPSSPTGAATLAAKKRLGDGAMRLARSVQPRMMMPLCTTSPGTVSSQLPPCSAAMSTMTCQGLKASTTSRGSSVGRLRCRGRARW
jgi:hypothetical protein